MSGEHGKNKEIKTSDWDRDKAKEAPIKKGCKILSPDQITEAIRENGGNIEFIRFESDVDGTAENEQGPWSYKNATKCFVVYRSGDNEKRILLENMIKRGFPKGNNQLKSFKYYSWLRLKEFAEKESSLEKVLGSNEDFLAYLEKVHEYYRKHPSCLENEGMMEFKCPQSYSDVSNTQLLHYYGKVP